MRKITCPCGNRFEAKSPRAVYCSGTCRQRASRAGVSSTKQAPAPTPEAPTLPTEVGSVVGAVIVELHKANALNTPAGLAAVKLAGLIDQATMMQGASVAAWTKEMRASIDQAKEKAPAAEVDPIDEIERKRRERRGA